MSYRCEILTTSDAFRILEPHWDDLFERADRPHLSQSCRWARCIWDIVAEPAGGRLHCVAVWSGEKLVLLWPMVVSRLHRLWTVARPLATPGDYANVLIDAAVDPREPLALAWDTLRQTSGADLIQFDPIRTDTPLYQFLARQGPAPPPREKVYSVTWDGFDDWPSYYRRLPRRKTVERHLRRLGDRGRTWFAVEQDGERYRQVVDWLFRQKEEWFVTKGHTYAYWIRSRPYKAFLSAAPEFIGGHGQIVAFTLMLDGDIIAGLIASVDRFRIEYIQVAYDLSYARYSPGHALTLHALEWAFNRRLTFDFRQGDFGYKKEFSNNACALASHGFVESRWGRVHENLKALKQASRRVARAGG